MVLASWVEGLMVGLLRSFVPLSSILEASLGAMLPTHIYSIVIDREVLKRLQPLESTATSSLLDFYCVLFPRL